MTAVAGTGGGVGYSGGAGVSGAGNAYLSLGTQLIGGIGQAYAAYSSEWMRRAQAAYEDKQRRHAHAMNQLVAHHQAKLDQYRRMSQKAYLQHQDAISEINAEQARGALGYQASIERLNARNHQVSKKMMQNAGEHGIARYSLSAGNVKARQRAALAKNGVVLGEGSAAELQDSADFIRAIDMNAMKSNIIMQSFGYDIQSLNANAKADALAAQRTGVMAQKHGAEMVDTNEYFIPSDYISSFNKAMYNPGGMAASSLLGSIGNVAQSWYNMKQTGVFGG